LVRAGQQSLVNGHLERVQDCKIARLQDWLKKIIKKRQLEALASKFFFGKEYY
jgi:hypothetical protein